MRRALAPAACGVLSSPTGLTTTFFASQEAGGLNCTLTVSFGANATSVALAVLHDARLLFEQKDDRVSVGLTLELQAELEQLVRGAEREPA